MKISVVTVCYNASSILEKTILSVVNQSYRNIEYIIIDGASKDGTEEIVKRYMGQIDYFLSEPDKGIYDAMNKAIDASTGEWIIFMNAGDTFVDNEVVEKVISCTNLGAVDVVLGDTVKTFPWGSMLVKSRICTKRNIGLEFCHQSVLVKTQWMKKYHFDTSFKVAADFNFLYQLMKEKCHFRHVDIPIAVYDTTGVSSMGRMLVYKETCRAKQCDHGLKYCLGLLWLKIKLYIKRILPHRIIALYFALKFNYYD